MNREVTDEVEAAWQHYRCYLRSASGMWAQYDGHVDVWAPDEHEVFERAVRALARSSFSDRPSVASWRLDRIERL